MAARKQPVPRALTEPVEFLMPETGTAARRSRMRHSQRRWRRRITRAFRTKRGRWVLIALACLAVLLVGLLSQGFLNSAAPAASVPGADGGADGTATGISSTPSPSPSKGKPGSKQDALVNDPVQLLRNRLPDNPLNHLDTHGLHHVTVSASAPGKMAVLGYLVPTGLGSAYGSVHTSRSSWSLREQALGRGYLAAVFIQTDRSGRPITCTVTVDGKVTSRETTSGAYGRAVCIG